MEVGLISPLPTDLRKAQLFAMGDTKLLATLGPSIWMEQLPVSSTLYRSLQRQLKRDDFVL